MRITLPWLLLLIFCCSTLTGSAILEPQGTGLAESTAPPGLTEFGPIVDSIVIDNRNVYDTDDPKYRHFIFKLANKFHYKTRTGVIKREILFEKGEPFPYELAEETARNLRTRLALFDAWIETDTLPNGHLLVRVVTIDEWTLALGPNFSRDGDQNIYDLSLTERNLFGRNQYLEATYVIQEDEENYFGVGFAEDRVLGNPVSIAANYSNDPTNERYLLSFGRPFYNLTQNYSFNINWSESRIRSDVRHNSRVIGQARTEGDRLATRFAVRTGSYKQKVVLTNGYTYLFRRTQDKTILSDLPADSLQAEASFPEDSAYHSLDIGVQIYNLYFAKRKNIDGIGYTEDFVLGQTAILSLGRAFTPGFDSYEYNKVGVVFSQGYQYGDNLFYLNYQRQVWFNSETNIRRYSELEAYFYNQGIDFITFAARANYLSDWRASDAEDLILGETSGIRGYEKYFRTGNRRLAVNFETRFFPGFEILTVSFSPTLFVDAGRAWKVDEPLDFGTVYYAGGAGLRIGWGHSARSNLTRIDLAYSEKNGWQISIGTDQYFLSRIASLFLTTR